MLGKGRGASPSPSQQEEDVVNEVSPISAALLCATCCMVGGEEQEKREEAERAKQGSGDGVGRKRNQAQGCIYRNVRLGEPACSPGQLEGGQLPGNFSPSPCHLQTLCSGIIGGFAEN